MQSVAARLTKEMDQILAFVELTQATFNLAKKDLKGFRSKHDLALAAKELNAKVRALVLGTAVPYEGAYLSACAQFELGVRDMIETYVSRLSQKFPSFSSLPKQIQDAHIEGCARILLNIRMEKFSHLKRDDVVRSIVSCANSIASEPYFLTPEAISDHDSNFKPDILFQNLARVGLKNIWLQLARQNPLKMTLGTTADGMTEHASKERLKSLMDKRNQIMHRGKTFSVPSESEVRECAEFFKALMQSMANVLEDNLVRL